MTVVGIYCLVFPSGHYYYGQSQNVHQRFREHVNTMRRSEHDNPRVQAVFKKFASSPVLRIACVCEVEKLDVAEQIFLDEAVGQPMCLNIGRDAKSPRRGIKSGPISKDHRERISAANRGRYFSPAHRMRISAAKKAQPVKGMHSPEARAKAAASRKGLSPSAEHRSKIAATLRGHVGAGRKSVILLNTGRLFDSVMHAEAELGVRAIGRAIRKGYSAGKMPDGTVMRWALYCP